jgi:hypothetical protein
MDRSVSPLEGYTDKSSAVANAEVASNSSDAPETELRFEYAVNSLQCEVLIVPQANPQRAPCQHDRVLHGLGGVGSR